MTRLTTYATCIAAGLLTMTAISAGQTPDVPPRTGGNGRSGYMGYRVEHGDTSYYDSIDPAWIFPRGFRGSRRDLKKYYRLVYNFNKVYPYALLARDMESQVDRHISENSLRRRKKEKYINRLQEELLDAYEKPLRGMTIRSYKSGISAGFWQGLAKVFGQDRKSHYDPKGEDKMTEYLVEKWQRGEFDALYYSIFWEMPKHPDIVSKEIKFDE